MIRRGALIVCVLLLVLDQVTKYVAEQYLLLGEPRPVIDGFFNFTLVYTPGAAFAMFGDLPDPWRRITLGAVSLLALLVVIRFMYKEARDDVVSQYALVAILSGAIGNIIDRVRFDAVIDFLDFYI